MEEEHSKGQDKTTTVPCKSHNIGIFYHLYKCRMIIFFSIKKS